MTKKVPVEFLGHNKLSQPSKFIFILQFVYVQIESQESSL
jgi:hypothetical protein